MIDVALIDVSIEEKYNSICCFSEENVFYNCITEKELAEFEKFENLGHSFYTFTINKNQEWIGYVLLHNQTLLKEYINYTFICIQEFKNKISEYKEVKSLDEILKKPFNKISLSEFNNKINLLLNTNKDIEYKYQQYLENLNLFFKTISTNLYLEMAIKDSYKDRNKEITKIAIEKLANIMLGENQLFFEKIVLCFNETYSMPKHEQKFYKEIFITESDGNPDLSLATWTKSKKYTN